MWQPAHEGCAWGPPIYVSHNAPKALHSNDSDCDPSLLKPWVTNASRVGKGDDRHVIRLEPGLWEWISVHIESYPNMGYRGHTDVVRCALREYLLKYGPEFTPKNTEGES
jgi:hypothetical protein